MNACTQEVGSSSVTAELAGRDAPLPEDRERVKDAIGCAWQAAIHPDDRARLDGFWRSLLASGQPGQTQARLERGDGVYRWFLFRTVPLLDEAGQIASWCGQNPARGQLNALTHTLDALASESDPDKFLEHVLRTITEQLGAHSNGLWRRDELTGLVSLEFVFERGKLATRTAPPPGAVSPSSPTESIWPWPEVFLTGKPMVFEDIAQGPGFPWRDHLMAQGIITVLILPMSIAGRVEWVINIRFARKRISDPRKWN